MGLGDLVSRLTPEEKRALAKQLLRERSNPAPGAEVPGGIPLSHYRWDHHPAAVGFLRAAEPFGFKDPYFRVHEGIAGATTVIEGKRYINYSNYNYLGLSGHPAVRVAGAEAIAHYGTSVSASRMVGG